MSLEKLNYEYEALQSSFAPKYEIVKVERLRASCRCVPHVQA
jgi:hypothetical protein